ncbi:hypothetical protein [Indioceanicola profundi]|uniref:hypothetical protein n=1 Tax=Indioceanicola profundi TaxID=2220096 RepID=UPI0013C45BC7|nr:hypothetical protein [Indioceanicola profundi]
MRKKDSKKWKHAAALLTSHRGASHALFGSFLSSMSRIRPLSGRYDGHHAPPPYARYHFAFYVFLTPVMFCLLNPLLHDAGIVNAVDGMFSATGATTSDVKHGATMVTLIFSLAASMGVERCVAPSLDLLHHVAKMLLALSWFLWRGILTASVGTLLVALMHAIWGG